MADDGDGGSSDKEVDGNGFKSEKLFTLKKWNAVAMWSWDVECDTCAICRVQVMGKLLSFSCSRPLWNSSFDLCGVILERMF